MKKKLIAVIVCASIYFSFFIAAEAIGWKRGGGVIPQLIFFLVMSTVMFGVYLFITRKRD